MSGETAFWVAIAVGAFSIFIGLAAIGWEWVSTVRRRWAKRRRSAPRQP